MPKKVIGKELTQDDIRAYMFALQRDHNVMDIDVDVRLEANGWIAVMASCWDYQASPAREYRTTTTYITHRGPHFDTAICQHLMALWHIVDRESKGLPRLIGL